MQFICFTKDMSAYNSAYYQNDFLKEIVKQAEVFFYGPDFQSYNKGDSVEDLIDMAGYKKENTVLLFAHSWLSDPSNLDICIDTNNYYNNDLYKVLILNKEYSRLEDKLNWAKLHNINLIFTHHTDSHKIQKQCGIDTKFWPFAVNPSFFIPSMVSLEKREYDLGYSGILQNLNLNREVHSDQRVKVLKEIYRIVFKKSLYKKRKYRKLNIFYNYFSSEFKNPTYKRLNDAEYVQLQQNSKLFLNTLSAGNLIGNRFFENMACKTAVFCEDSPVYNKIFPDDIVIKFSPDMSDFYTKLLFYSRNLNALETVINNAYDFVLNNHTWEIRTKELLNEIKFRNHGEQL